MIAGLFEPPAALLAWFYSFTHNYIIAISMIALVIMIITAPLVLKSTKGMLEMQKLQPEMRKLQQEHRGDRQKLNEEMMKLYQQHKVNPMASCFPLLLQMPVFIIMYQVLRGLTRGGTDDAEGSPGRAQGADRGAPQVRSSPSGRNDGGDDPAEGPRGLARPRLPGLHRAVRGHGRVIRHRHRRDGEPDRRVLLPRLALPLRPLKGEMTRVIISGLGVVSPYGVGAKTFWAGLATGECTINPCGNVQCPFCYSCMVDPSGQASCQPNDDSPGSACSTLKIQTSNAGGGCACSVEGGSNAGSLFASGGALLGLALVARRRRGRDPRRSV